MRNHFKPLSSRRVMWGKYAGCLFSEVPTSYLEWFAANAYPQMKNRRAWAIEELERRKAQSQSQSNPGTVP